MRVLSVTLLVLAAVCGTVHCAAMSSSESMEIVHATEEQDRADRNECMKELKLSEDELTEEDGQKAHTKVLTCMLKKHGVITTDGKFSADMMIARSNRRFRMEPEIAADIKKSVEKCRPELESATGLKEEELAGKIMRCVTQNRSLHDPMQTTTTAKSM